MRERGKGNTRNTTGRRNLGKNKGGRNGKQNFRVKRKRRREEGGRDGGREEGISNSRSSYFFLSCFSQTLPKGDDRKNVRSRIGGREVQKGDANEMIQGRGRSVALKSEFPVTI